MEAYLEGGFIILIEEKLHGFGAIGIIPAALRRVHAGGIQTTHLLDHIRMSG